MKNRARSTKKQKVVEIKSFTCDVCDQSFSEADILKIHVKTHENGQIFSCNSCDIIFWSRVKLQQHIQKRHKEIINKIIEVKCEKIIKSNAKSATYFFWTEKNYLFTNETNIKNILQNLPIDYGKYVGKC